MRPGHPSRDDAESLPTGDAESAAAGRVAAHVEAVDGREECTLFPADASGESLVTTWLTAADDAFVDLAEYR